MVSKSEYNAMTGSAETGRELGDPHKNTNDGISWSTATSKLEGSERKGEEFVSIGATKKRKSARVVGEDEAGSPKKVKAKKTKKVKLSFDN